MFDLNIKRGFTIKSYSFIISSNYRHLLFRDMEIQQYYVYQYVIDNSLLFLLNKQ